jgi:hypothetical protein
VWLIAWTWHGMDMAGWPDELPDFIFGKGSSFKQHNQKVTPACVPWDKCTLSAPDTVVLPNVAPGQFVQMLSKKQRLHTYQEIIPIEFGYCNDTSQLNEIEQIYHQHIGIVQALLMVGFRVAKGVHCIPIGFGGTVFRNLHALLCSSSSRKVSGLTPTEVFCPSLYCVPFKFLLPLCRICHIA